jgi:hypothetical protein
MEFPTLLATSYDRELAGFFVWDRGREKHNMEWLEPVIEKRLPGVVGLCEKNVDELHEKLGEMLYEIKRFIPESAGFSITDLEDLYVQMGMVSAKTAYRCGINDGYKLRQVVLFEL